MGGGIGYCTVKNKTFSYSMTRSQAEAALKAINVGEGATKSLGTLLLAALGGPVGSVVGLSVSVILNFIGGESTYVSHLKSFLNSGKSVAYFKYVGKKENLCIILIITHQPKLYLEKIQKTNVENW